MPIILRLKSKYKNKEGIYGKENKVYTIYITYTIDYGM